MYTSQDLLVAIAHVGSIYANDRGVAPVIMHPEFGYIVVTQNMFKGALPKLKAHYINHSINHTTYTIA